MPRTPSGPATPAPTYIVHQAQQVAQAAPVKKKTPEERLDPQASSLYSLANVQGSEYLPEIWQTLSHLTKEKAQPAFKISCRESVKSPRCKAPRVTHAVAVLFLGIHFFNKYPDCVNNIINIFQFPDLSLSVGSKASMVNQRWDTTLDANTMTSHVDEAALMKQQRLRPFVGWEAAVKILEHWLAVVTVLLGPQERHPSVFELATLLEAA